MAVYTNRIVKMKEHLPFCREFSILCIEDRELLLILLFNFEKEPALKDSAF